MRSDRVSVKFSSLSKFYMLPYPNVYPLFSCISFHHSSSLLTYVCLHPLEETKQVHIYQFTGKVKLKLSLCLTKHYTVKTYEGVSFLKSAWARVIFFSSDAMTGYIEITSMLH
jgi:hypothetical protein